MTQERNRDRVMAEVTSFHLMRLANEHGCNFSREQAINAFDSAGCPNLITPWLSAFLITSFGSEETRAHLPHRFVSASVSSLVAKGSQVSGRSSSNYSCRNLEDRLLLEC